MQTDNEDKREFFRIQDQMALDCKPIDGPDADLGRQHGTLFDLLSDMHMLDYESQHLLRQISERDRALAQYLKVINKRIDLLGKTLAVELSGDFGDPIDVILSEGGMSFESTEAYPVDSWLAVHMILLPAPLGLAIPGRVVRCDRNATDQGWTLGINFDVMTDAQRQLLARHILQKQAQEIRAAKSTERTSS
ncbi:MAG TPA: PilZ domain-containing protein [Pseudomonas sabulinigri]|uniref:PilZ domain-containing protein n=1 Tax=marine sediment metagenome TaxID=412755 RepID=A0A0F9XJQ7_9ZZZZ|nr:PilZ domain-containing protein [Halopseudomonas sabulinigri]HEC53232.1 PilZ domain-containing protein [Halopseudomonas sabulinigri]|tara:strand:+ start:17527 stop:18102 length:576 start_codon:yes stop_codon:yes gene_type:complete